MQYRRVGGFAAAAGDFPEVGEAALACCALGDEEARGRVGWGGGGEYEGADGEVGVLCVLSEEGGEGDGEMAEGGGDVDLDRGLGVHGALTASWLGGLADRTIRLEDEALRMMKSWRDCEKLSEQVMNFKTRLHISLGACVHL